MQQNETKQSPNKKKKYLNNVRKKLEIFEHIT